MKQFLFSTLIILLCISSNAQLNGKVSEVMIYKDSVLNFFNQGNIVMNIPKYKFLFENEKGKVLESPVDKMRCLAADFPSTMPVAGKFLKKNEPEIMPNGMNANSQIPDPLERKK
jgi:hypothetical protein